jgi:hypothetical protein
MTKVLQLKRGKKENLPTLSAGEPAFTTDTNELYIGTDSGNISISGGSGSSIDDTTSSDTSTYSSNKVLSITGDINDPGLPSIFKGKTIIEMLKANFSNANEAKNLIINAIGDASLATTNSFEEISNYLIAKKQEIVNALANKGVAANDYEDIVNYATYINGIVQNSQLKHTKLNKTAGETVTVTLTNPTNIQSICTTVLQYQPGTTGVVQYDCDFNNSDSSNFDTTNNIVFDGKMSQDNKSLKIIMTDIGAVGKYESYTATIDKTQFYKVSSVSEANESNKETVTVTGTYSPILVQAKSDISLIEVDNIASIRWTATATNSSKLLLVYSIDSGVSWKGYDAINHTVLNISNINDLSEVQSKGLTITNVNSLTADDLINIRNSSPKIRFAYYFAKDLATDTVANDKITLTVNMTGKDVFSKNYNLDFDGNNQLTYTFTSDGTYTIVYMDNN